MVIREGAIGEGRETGETDARDSCLHSPVSEGARADRQTPRPPMNGVLPILVSHACLGSYAYRSASAASGAFGRGTFAPYGLWGDRERARFRGSPQGVHRAAHDLYAEGSGGVRGPLWFGNCCLLRPGESLSVRTSVGHAWLPSANHPRGAITWASRGLDSRPATTRPLSGRRDSQMCPVTRATNH